MKPDKVFFQNLSDVEPQEIDWLWEPLIPYSMVTILEGDPGISKSYLAMHIASQVSIGGILPGGNRLIRGRVLYLSAEDDAAFTIRPRIDTMRGDPKRIRFQSRYSPFDDQGLRILRQEVNEHQPDLIVVDPLYAYVPSGSDMYKPNEIRALLSALGDIAVKSEAAMIVIRHLTKAKRDKAIYQGVGSIDVIGAARSALLVARHPDNDAQQVIAHVKHNISARGDSWIYEMATKGEDLPILKWIGKSDLTADDLLNTPSGGASALEGAIEFLEEFLEEGPQPAAEVISAAESDGIARRTLDRAKRQLDISAKKTGSIWTWSLPDNK